MYEQRNGRPVFGIKFKDVISGFEANEKKLIKSGERTEKISKDYLIKIHGNLIPYFKDTLITDIQKKQLIEYKNYRIEKDSVVMNTVQHDYVALRRVLEYCIDQGHITKLPDIPKRNKKETETNPRPNFSKEEWSQLQEASKKRIKDSRSERIRKDRDQLHDYMMWIVHTGMRVEETLRTKFQDIEIKKKKNGQHEVVVQIDGKTGFRTVRGLIGAVKAFKNIKKRNPDHQPDDLLFSHNPRDGLKALLQATGLNKSSKGRNRDAKSFRATYICFRLTSKGSGSDIDKIARNCGTSPEVIKKYYSKFLGVDQFDEEFTDLY